MSRSDENTLLRSMFENVVELGWPENQKAAAIDIGVAPSTLNGWLSADRDRRVSLLDFRRACTKLALLFTEKVPDLVQLVVRHLIGVEGRWVPARVDTRPRNLLDELSDEARVDQEILNAIRECDLEKLGVAVANGHRELDELLEAAKQEIARRQATRGGR